MAGRIYICVSGGVVQNVLTDDQQLTRLPITIIDHDCDAHIGSHRVSYNDHPAQAGDVGDDYPRLCTVRIRDPRSD